MKTKLFSALIALSVLACNNKNQQNDTQHEGHESEQLANDPVGEVLAIHDSIMPQMDKIMALKMEVNRELKTTDSLIAIKSTDALTSRKKQASELITKLDAADKEMMGWMHQYKGDTLKKLNEDEGKKYIADQKEKILNVKKVMETSLTEAGTFLEKK